MRAEKYKWANLTKFQIGRYAEYFTKMELTLYGFDVYTSEVDDHGIDFVAKKNGQYYDVQVKSIRSGATTYVYMTKNHFVLRPNLWLALIIFTESELPSLYLIPSMNWANPDSLLVSRDYIEKASKPEWGINLSKKNMSLLEPYRIENMADTLFR